MALFKVRRERIDEGVALVQVYTSKMQSLFKSSIKLQKKMQAK